VSEDSYSVLRHKINKSFLKIKLNTSFSEHRKPLKNKKQKKTNKKTKPMLRTSRGTAGFIKLVIS
jgi:hypothetical protein